MGKFARPASAAQGFAGSDPGHGHGTAHQAMPRWVSHIAQAEGPATKICNYLLGGFGEKKKKKKQEDWQQLLAQVPIFKKQQQKNQKALKVESIFIFYLTCII